MSSDSESVRLGKIWGTVLFGVVFTLIVAIASYHIATLYSVRPAPVDLDCHCESK